MNLRARQLLPYCLPPLLLAGMVTAWCLAGSQWDGQVFAETLRRLAPGTLLALCGLHLAQQLGRTARLSLLLAGSVGWTRLAAAVLLHQFFSAMLPLKTGSLSLPELLKREGIERARTWAAMVAGMGLDLIGITLLMLLAALGLELLPATGAVPGNLTLLQRPLLVVCVCLVGLALLGWSGSRRVQRWLDHPSRHGSRSGWREVVTNRLRAFLGTLAELTWGQAVGGTLLSLLNLVLALAFSFLFCRQLAPELDWRSILLVILVMRLVGKFAIQGLAGLGSSEAILVLLFCGIGLSPTEAVAVTLLGRVFHLGLITAGGGLGALLLLWQPRRQTVWPA